MLVHVLVLRTAAPHQCFSFPSCTGIRYCCFGLVVVYSQLRVECLHPLSAPQRVREVQRANKARLDAEYNRLVQGLVSTGIPHTRRACVVVFPPSADPHKSWENVVLSFLRATYRGYRGYRPVHVEAHSFTHKPSKV